MDKLRKFLNGNDQDEDGDSSTGIIHVSFVYFSYSGIYIKLFIQSIFYSPLAII